MELKEALNIVSAVVFVATGTPEHMVAPQYRPAALSHESVQRALIAIRNACEHQRDTIIIPFAAGAEHDEPTD